MDIRDIVHAERAQTTPENAPCVRLGNAFWGLPLFKVTRSTTTTNLALHLEGLQHIVRDSPTIYAPVSLSLALTTSPRKRDKNKMSAMSIEDHRFKSENIKRNKSAFYFSTHSLKWRRCLSPIHVFTSQISASGVSVLGWHIW